MHEKTLFVPAAGISDAPDLSNNPRDSLDVTAKLFFLENAQNPVKETQTALDLLENAIGIQGADLFIMQGPNMHYEDPLRSEEEEEALVNRERQRYNASVLIFPTC